MLSGPEFKRSTNKSVAKSASKDKGRLTLSSLNIFSSPSKWKNR